MTRTHSAWLPAWLWGAIGALLLSVAVAGAQPASDGARPTPATAPPKVRTPPRATPAPRVEHRVAATRPALRVIARRAPTPSPSPSPAARQPPPPVKPPSRKPPSAPKHSGLALQLSLGPAAQVYANVNATSAYPGMSGRFGFGYRAGRVTIGLGLEFVRTESTDTAGEKRIAHVVLFRPTLELVLWQSWPLSLYLSLGVHAGFLGTAGRGVVDDELPAVGFHSGLGVRYFFHPRFALGMEGGFQGVWLVDDDGDDTVDGMVMFYGALVLLAIL